MDVVLADNGTFYYSIQGRAEGTVYNIVYQDESSYKPEIERILYNIEKSLSVYDPESIISKVNRNENIEIDNYFSEVLLRSKEISSITEGRFDISAEPLFSAWGFSFKEKEQVDLYRINELKKLTGLDKFKIEGKKYFKSAPNLQLNMNAIAKGYSVDIIASFLEDVGCNSYMVEIGGEIRLKGLNPEMKPWRIGIDKPAEDNPIPGQDLLAILHITDRGIATSGNNRQFYIQDGKKICHTIDPFTGYPVLNNLLSVTVVAQDTMSADAFATAFMVGGIDKSLEWIDKVRCLDAIFVCQEGDNYKVCYTSGIEDNIELV